MFINGGIDSSTTICSNSSNRLQLKLEQKSDQLNIPYNMISQDVSILTPTSPSCSSTPFFIAPFQSAFSYSNNISAKNFCHTGSVDQQCNNNSSLAKLTETKIISNQKPTQVCVKREQNYSDFTTTSVVDTPTSIFSSTPCSESYSADANTKDAVFKFEPEYIQRFQQACQYDEPNLFNLDSEYFNYDEINCQSKTHSPCSSPLIDPWMCLSLNGSTSPKQSNHQNCYQSLPPMKIFSNQFQTSESHISEYYDTAFLEVCTQPTVDQNQIQDNFNTNDEDKPNREYKNIWQLQTTSQSSDQKMTIITTPTTNTTTTSCITVLSDIDENTANIEDVFTPSPKPQITKVLSTDTGIDEQFIGPLECQWMDCYQMFSSQSALVSHIEKRHVEQKKSDEFSCYWLDCVRRNKPFNARYKLLIHMRVHSGEKPNKCPVSRVCN